MTKNQALSTALLSLLLTAGQTGCTVESTTERHFESCPDAPEGTAPTAPQAPAPEAHETTVTKTVNVTVTNTVTNETTTVTPVEDPEDDEDEETDPPPPAMEPSVAKISNHLGSELIFPDFRQMGLGALRIDPGPTTQFVDQVTVRLSATTADAQGVYETNFGIVSCTLVRPDEDGLSNCRGQVLYPATGMDIEFVFPGNGCQVNTDYSILWTLQCMPWSWNPINARVEAHFVPEKTYVRDDAGNQLPVFIQPN